MSVTIAMDEYKSFSLCKDIAHVHRIMSSIQCR